MALCRFPIDTDVPVFDEPLDLRTRDVARTETRNRSSRVPSWSLVTSTISGGMVAHGRAPNPSMSKIMIATPTLIAESAMLNVQKCQDRQ